MDDGVAAHAQSDGRRVDRLATYERSMIMRSIARRHPFAVFLAIAYGISAAAFALPLLSNAGIGVIDVDLPGAAPFILVSAVGLAVAAFVATALADGREGVRDLRRRTFRFRVKPAWYVVAFFLLPGAAFAAALVVTGVDPIARLASNPVVLAGIVVGAVVAFALVNWWEETAWTGFALERLQDRIGPIGASVVTTWLQALVHVPLVFVADGVTVGRVPAEQIPFYLVALFVLPIPVRLVLTWVYNASGRSLPIVGLYHAGLGVATGAAFLPVLAPGIAPIVAYAGFAVLAAVVLVVTRGRLGIARSEPDQRAAVQPVVA
jgi:membrane protease YdiL (CAAX protease family)